MTVSRRFFLTGALAGTAAAATGPIRPAAAKPLDNIRTANDFSGVGDLIGKITVGYQGWFGAAGDGQALGWWHTAKDWGQPPSPDNETFWAWPDNRDFDHVYRTGYEKLGNGQPATVFSSYDYQTVDTHFRWMQENSLDTAALQRFNPTGAEGPPRDAVTAHVRAAAEKYDRKFYVMYDASGWTNVQTEIKDDWTRKMHTYTASSAYAHQSGKPVVGIWGFGFDDDNHPWSQEVCIDVITWFQDQGCYVMGGVPTHWLDGTDDSRANYLEVYRAFDCVSPWMVGRISDAAGSDHFYEAITTRDVAECRVSGMDYQPCVIPGDLNQHHRKHGDLMWRQFYNVVRAGAPAIYISMFDEFNESNQIAKTAESLDFVPENSKFVPLDEDGTRCTADYYLRLSGDGGRMLKGQIALTAIRPTPPWIDETTGTPAGTGPFALRAQATGMYLAGTPLTATTASPTETFQVVQADGDLIALRSSTGKFVCTENAGADPLVVNREAAGGWEMFTLVRNADGSISLRCHANGKYVSVQEAGRTVIANRGEIEATEKFELR